MRKFISLVLTLFTLAAGSGQDYDQKLLEQLKFRNIGPAGMSGRVTAIDVDLSNSNHILVGTASGGLWESTDGGTSWKPIFDKMDCLAIGSVKINQRNTHEIWVGTGEGNPRNSLNTGRGIYKSIDGGKTWKKMGLENTKTIHRIIIHRDNPDIVFAAALGSPWGPNAERGVFKTTDGGKTWNKILYVDESTGAADMVVDPTNPNKLIVAMWEHGRKPWFFNSGGPGSGIYLTYDAGENWKKITDKEGMPKGDLGRIGLAISPSKPNIVYALVEAKENGLYKSTDGGEKWSLVSTKNIGNRPFYYAELYVDPLNENRLFNLYTYVSKSEDGGKTFEVIMDYGNNVHPDHHAFWIHPENPDYMIGGSDGGMTISRDGGHNWTFVNNLPVGQFYHINIDNDFPYNVYGGLQDNGSWIGPSSVFKRGGIRNYDFTELSFGDGFDVVPFRKDSRYGYSMSQQGYVGFYDRLTGFSRFIRPLHPDSIELRFNWNTAIAQDPFDDCGVYFGSQFVHHSTDCGDSWNIISPDLTTNDSSKQQAHLSGGLTIDATGAENHTTILAIAPSTHDEKVIYAGTDDGRLQRTMDGGKTWTDLYNRLPGAPANGWIPQIELSPFHAGEAFVVVNNYRQNDYKPYLYHTVDFGQTWRSLVTPDFTEFILCIVQDPEEKNLLFAGADNGLFVSFDKGKKWTHLNENFPQVQVSDLKIQKRERDLVIGTFGRSIWILDDIEALRQRAKNGAVFEKDFHLFQSNPGYDISFRSVDGVRFIAQGEFVGDNDGGGGLAVTAWVKPAEKQDETKDGEEGKEEEKKDKKDKRSDKVEVAILDMDGDTIRNFSRKLEEGINRFNWNLETNGVEYPSKRTPREDRDPPWGPEALPGKYVLHTLYNGQRDSIRVEVRPDPRRNIDREGLESKKQSLEDFQLVITAAKEAYDQVKEARASIKLSESLLENQPDSVSKAVKKMHKRLNKELDSIDVVFFGKEYEKGIQRDENTLTNDLRTASRYIGASAGVVSGTALIAIEKARASTARAVAAVNAFFDEDWETYKTMVEAIKPMVFKEIKTVEFK